MRQRKSAALQRSERVGLRWKAPRAAARHSPFAGWCRGWPYVRSGCPQGPVRGQPPAAIPLTRPRQKRGVPLRWGRKSPQAESSRAESLDRGSSETKSSEGGRRFRKASPFSTRRGISRRKGAAAARRASTLRAERDRDEGCSRIGEVGDKVGRRAIVARCPRATRCQSTLHGGPGLARRGRLVPTSRSTKGLHARRLACGPRGLGCAHGRARGWIRLQESVSDVRVVRPEVMSLGIVRKGLRATLVGRMREHRR